jgi:WhiB family redox-sensing transcriptional regulator
VRGREELLLAVGVRIPAWQKQAACRGMGVNAMYPQGRGDAWSVRAAKEVCAQCSVVDECKTFALEHNDWFGVWGGTSQKDRVKLIPAHRAGRA